jgi:nucleolar protein 53
VWNKVDTIPAPKDLPPPAVLPYSKSAPAQAPTTLQSSKRRLRHREKAVSVPEGGQSYNPTLEEWEDIINRTAIKEQHRLADIAKRERVATPESDDGTPAQDDEEREEEEEQRGESYLGKPVQLRRKTRAQRNKQARLAEEVLLLLQR